MLRARVLWTGPIVTGGGVSTFYSSNDAADAQDFVDALGTFFEAIKDRLNNNQLLAVENVIDVIDPATGNITTQTTVTPWSKAGTDATEALPIATQGLVRWRTGSFIGGRELRGRTFIPGFTETQSSGGAPSAACVNDVNVAAAALDVSTAAGLVVWSRTHLQFSSTSSASFWTQWAVLRSRRD